MLFYKFVRPFARITLKVFFKKIYLHNADSLPRDKPIILAANHPTSFIEPCLMAVLLPMDLYYLARGNLFKKEFFIRILHSLNIYPIFRKKDGNYNDLKRNFSTLEKCYKLISEKKPIMILAEGACTQEKRLRPIQKGTARLAFGAIEKYKDLDIEIYPLGVNYTNPDDFRSEVMISVGEPIRVSEFLEQYNVEPAKAIRSLTKVIATKLEKEVIIIDDANDDQVVEQLFEIDRNNQQELNAFPVLHLGNERLMIEKEIAQKVNELDEFEKEGLKTLGKSYFLALDHQGITDYGLTHFEKHKMLDLLGLLGYPFYLLGLLVNGWITFPAHNFTEKKVKDIEDRASVKIVLVLGSFLLKYTVLILLALFLKSKLFWGVLVGLPFLGIFTVLFRDWYAKRNERVQARKLDTQAVGQLREMRKTFVKELAETTYQ